MCFEGQAARFSLLPKLKQRSEKFVEQRLETNFSLSVNVSELKSIQCYDDDDYLLVA